MSKLSFLLIIVLVISCTKQEPEIDYALFSGKIQNPSSETIIVSGNDFEQKIKVSTEGVFTDTLHGIKPGYYNFYDGGENASFYLEPGFNLTLTLNTEEFDETMKYTGEGAENSNFLVMKYLKIEEIKDTLTSYRAFFSLDEAAFLEKVSEIKTTLEGGLNKSENLSPNFIALENKNIQYSYLLDIQRYPEYHSYYTDNENFEVSSDFLKPLAEINYTNEGDFKSISSYKDLVMGYYSSKIDASTDPVAIFEEFDQIESQLIKEDLLKNIARQISATNEDNELYYSSIMKMSGDDEFKTKLTEKYTAIKAIMEGMPSPSFTNYENHKGGTTDLNDFKGKYVYIDIWATWCGPCLQEIPHLKEVEEQFHDKNIEFVSISVDKEKDHGTWFDMVNEKELTGQQLFPDTTSTFVKEYVVNTIPRFILIDPDGNIVSADAPRPSSSELVELLGEMGL